MPLVRWSIFELMSYGLIPWLLFVGIAFGGARIGRIPGMIVGHFLVAVAVVVLDVTWIQSEMRRPGWNGQPDQDIVFILGVLFRVALVNVVLVPVSLVGLWRSQRLRLRRSRLR